MSIGIAYRDDPTVDAEQMLRNADLAMYQAKAGPEGFAVYAPQMHEGLVARMRLEADLRKALAEEQFVVHYQPMMSMRTGEMTGVEALVRWQHPERGLIPPNDFIPLAEATGLIRPLGLWVLREACRQAVAWEAEGRDHRGAQAQRQRVGAAAPAGRPGRAGRRRAARRPACPAACSPWR